VKITSREDAIEFRKLRDHIGVISANDKLTSAEIEYIDGITAIMCTILHCNGYGVDIGRETVAWDPEDGAGGWKGYL